MRGPVPPLRQHAFMAFFLVKHRNNFTFDYKATLLTALDRDGPKLNSPDKFRYRLSTPNLIEIC
jgi:hypothetical protein